MWAFQYKHGDRPLEGFTIQRAAGRGGFGEVYYALSDSGREVALKVVQGYEQIELRGISQCMNLKSPHLVSIFDVKHNHEQKPFVIMEFVSGPNLRQLLDESPAGLGTQKSAFFLREIAKGLTFLHECGIVHRDLKPANIFYENGYVKIGDYGLSKAITTSQYSGQTVTVGTVHYMAPEIGAGRYDRSIDIYAMGAVLYEMLTGTPPFVGASPSEVLMKHLSAEPDVSGIPQPFARVIQKALAKDPNQRYRTIQEMVEDVFGAEHVRQSVSVFAPEDLSVIAERVAKKSPVAVGAGGGGAGASSSSPGTAQNDPWARVGSWMDEVGGRVKQMWHEPPGAVNPAVTPAAAEMPHVFHDPLPARHRWQIAILISILAPIAATLVSPRSMGAPIISLVFVFTLMWGAAIGLLIANRSIVPRLGNDSVWVQRLIAGQFAALFGVVLSLPAWATGDFSSIGGTLIAVLAPLFIFDTQEELKFDRAERVGFGDICGAGGAAFVLALIFDGRVNLAIAAAAGMSMIVQILSPWDPNASAMRKARKEAGEENETPSGTATASGAAAAVNSAGVKMSFQQAPAHDSAAEMHAGAVELPRYWSRPVWPFARIGWVLGFVVLLTMGILFCVASATTRNPFDAGPFLAAGISSMVLGLLCMLKALQKRFYGWWGYLIKPVVMTACIASILSSILVLNMLPVAASEDEIILSTFFIAFPALVFIVLLFIPGKFPAVRQPDGSRQPLSASRAGSISPYRKNWALILTALAFAAVCGLQRLYVGKIVTGIIWLVTWGLCGIGQLIDAIQILRGEFKDKQGRKLVQWDASPMPDSGTSPDGEPFAPAAASPAAAPAVPPGVTVDMHEARRNQYVAPPRRDDSMVVIGDLNFGGLLSALGGLLLFVATLATLALAIDVPGMLQAGVPTPDAAREMELNVFAGVPDWPGLMRRLGAASVAVVMIVALTALVFARQRGGVIHMLRGIMGSIGLLAACGPIADTIYRRLPWESIGKLVSEKHYAPAVDEFVINFRTANGVLAASIFLVSIILLAWPARKYQAPAVDASQPTILKGA